MIRIPNRAITRDEAISRRLTWFFTGKPCKHGHVSTRNVNNYVCHACKRKGSIGDPKTAREETKAWKKAFHEKWLAERKMEKIERLARERVKRELELVERLLS